MAWQLIALATSDALGVILVVRLLLLRLHSVYKVFSAYVVFVLASSSVVYFELSKRVVDYRLAFLGIAVATWILTFWMVYASLSAILAKLPGILRFSRKLLIGVFVGALIVSLLFARSGFAAAKAPYPTWSLDSAVALSTVVERVITTVFMVALLAIQGFVLWFPVRLPRNLVFFTAGFVFNFVVETVLLVLRGLLPPKASDVIDPLNLFVLSLCFAYFTIVITQAGESVPTVVGHQWHPEQQQRLVRKLDEINSSLLKSAGVPPRKDKVA